MERAIKPRQAWKQRKNEPMLYADAIYRKFVKEVEKVKQLEDPFLRVIVAGDVRDDVWLKSDVLSAVQRDVIDFELAEIIETSAEEARLQIWEEF